MRDRPDERVRSAGRATTPGEPRPTSVCAERHLHLHFACESRTTRRLALTLDSLVRVSRRVGRVADATTDPERVRDSCPEPAARPPRALRTVPEARRTGRSRTVANPPQGERAASLPRSAAGPLRRRAVTPPRERGPPSRRESGRLRTGRGPRRSLVRWSGTRAAPAAARERPLQPGRQRAPAPN